MRSRFALRSQRVQRGTRDRRISGRRCGWLALACAAFVPQAATAADLYVDAAAAAGGDGSQGNPFTQIQDALDVAVASDVIHVVEGTYAPVTTTTDGTADGRITVVGEPSGSALVQANGTALEAHHAYHTFQGLVFDGGYGAGDGVDADGANFLELLDVEVRRAGRDCIDLHTVDTVLIANASIHHCVANDEGALVDAHGVTGDSVFDLELRDTEIYLFSGDAVQMSPPRLAWDGLSIRRCTLWTGALDEAAGPIAAGTLIGENALDTKVGRQLNGAGALPRVEIEDTVAYGFRDVITNQAAFNLKEEVDVLVDRVTVYDSELAFRLRGPAAVIRVQTAVVYDVDAAVRYEDGLTDARLLASTLGGAVGEAFVDGGGDDPVGFVAENLLVLGDAVPAFVAGGAANLAVGPEVFVDAAGHDYHLADGSTPIDAGIDIDGATLDRDGNFRPGGAAFDVGAFEWGSEPPPPPPGGTDDGGSSGGGSGSLDDTGGGSGGATDGGTSNATATGPGATGLDTGGASSGCGCRQQTSGGWWALLGIAALVRRRHHHR